MEKDKYIVDFYKNTGSIPKLKSFSFEDPLQTAFKFSPERAIEWLKQRGNNLKVSTDCSFRPKVTMCFAERLPLKPAKKFIQN